MKQLIIFLRKHKVLTRYKKNLKKHGRYISLEYFCSVASPESHIGGGFDWDKTDEGLEFWVSLDNKWKETL